MSEKNELIDRIAIFEDSDEIANALRDIAATSSVNDAYWLKEAAIHIEGLFELTQELGNALKATDG